MVDSSVWREGEKVNEEKITIRSKCDTKVKSRKKNTKAIICDMLFMSCSHLFLVNLQWHVQQERRKKTTSQQQNQQQKQQPKYSR